MSTKRQPSKQRRQSQNKANREALEKRRQNAEAGKIPSGKVGGETTAAPAKSGGVLSRLTGSTRAATGSSTSSTRTGTTAAAKPGAKQYPTGYRAALTALFLAFIGLVFAATLKAPVDHSGEMLRNRDDQTADWAWAAGHEALQQPDATAEDLAKDVDWNPGGTEPYVKVGLPYSAALILPFAASALAFWSVRKGATSKVLNRCMYASLFGALLNTQLAIMFLPAAIAIGFAGYQVRKEEMANAPVPADPGPEPPDDEGEVIDVAEVEPVEAELVEVDEGDVTEVGEPEAVEPEIVEPAAPRPKAAGGLQLTNRADDD